MIAAPSNWDTLWNSEFDLELRFTIDGVNYYNDSILLNDGRLTHYLYTAYGIGNACIGKFTITLIDPQPIARGVRQCTLACRLTNGTLTTEWVPQGTFYLNTVEKDTDGNYKLGLFDGLALCDVYLYPGGVVPSSISYPRAATTEIRAICTKAGIPAPSDLSAFTGMQVTAPTNMTCRQILQSLAAMAGGNWTMAKDGKLRFIPLGNYSGTPAYKVTVSGITQTSDRQAVTGVSLTNNSEHWEFGSDSGIMLNANCVYATQSVATALYSKVLNKQYQGYTLDGVYLSPLVELGDYIEVADSGERLLLDNYTVVYSQGLWGTVSAPMKTEVEQRIQYHTDQERSINYLGQLAENNANAIKTMGTAEYISDLIGRINEQANETGGYTYIVEGEGIRTYDVPIDDLSDDSAAHSVVEIKGGTIRIANSRDSLGNWDWKTVFTSGHIAADLVTAASIVTGFIGSPSGNFWNLDTGQLRITSDTGVVDPSGEVTLISTINEDAQAGARKRIGATNLLNGTGILDQADISGDWEKLSWAISGTATVVDMETPNPNLTRGIHTTSTWNMRQTNVPVTVGEEYVISAYGRGVGKFYIGAGKPSATNVEVRETPELVSGWNRYYLRITTTADMVENGKISVRFKGAAGQYISGMKMERGTATSDWSPSPYDKTEESSSFANEALSLASEDAITKAEEAAEKAAAYTDKAVEIEGTNVRALLDKKIVAITKDAKDYTDRQKQALSDELTQKNIFDRLTNKGKAQGLYLEGGLVYINATYMKTGVLDAGIIRAGILEDQGGKNRWNLVTGYFTTKNAELVNCNVNGTLTSGTGNQVQFNEGTVRFFNGKKNAMTIDGALAFTDGSYGAHITFSKYLVLRGPALATSTSKTGRGTIGFTGSVRIRNLTYDMTNSMDSCKIGNLELTFVNGLFTGVTETTQGLTTIKNKTIKV